MHLKEAPLTYFHNTLFWTEKGGSGENYQDNYLYFSLPYVGMNEVRGTLKL